MKWERAKIGDCCEVTSSKRIFFSEYVDSGVPFYRSKEIIECSNGQAISEPLFIKQEKYNEIKRSFGVPQPGDMLLTSVGTVGIPYIVQEKDYFYFKDGNLTWFRNFNDKLNSRYLYFWIKSSEGQGILNNTTIGSSQKALTIASLKGLEIPCPPTPIQNRIVEILVTYDDLIENNQKQIKLLEEAAQRLYKEWFVDLRFPGHENVKIVDGVPEGWRTVKLSDVANVNKACISERYPYDYVDYVDLGSVSRGHIEAIARILVQGAPSRAKRLAFDGDIIWGMVRPNLKSYALVLHPSETSVYSTGFAVLSAQKVPFSFLYCCVTQDDFVSYLVNCTNGAAYPAVKPDHFREAAITLPTDSLLRQFNLIAEPMYRKIEILEKQIKRSKEARDRLLPILMNREIEV